MSHSWNTYSSYEICHLLRVEISNCTKYKTFFWIPTTTTVCCSCNDCWKKTVFIASPIWVWAEDSRFVESWLLLKTWLSHLRLSLWWLLYTFRWLVITLIAKTASRNATFNCKSEILWSSDGRRFHLRRSFCTLEDLGRDADLYIFNQRCARWSFCLFQHRFDSIFDSLFT